MLNVILILEWMFYLYSSGSTRYLLSYWELYSCPFSISLTNDKLKLEFFGP